MTGYVAKDIQDQSIGQILRERREGRGLTLDDVERVTRIGKKYISAIEQDDFKKLPDLVYSKNFVRGLAVHYGLDPGPLVKALVQEIAAVNGQPVEARGLDRYADGRKTIVTPKLFRTAAMGLIFAGIVGYFAYSVNRILMPPKIVVYAPQDNQVYKDRHVVLEGATEPEVELTVNQEPVLTEADGSFKDALNLPAGVSVIRVAAKKKHSKENEVFLKVVVEAPEASATATPPVAHS